MPKIDPFLWFDDKAEEAANFYVSVFPNARIVEVVRYGDVGPGLKGSVMTVAFDLDGQRFNALNGGPVFRFTEAISFVVDCKDQAEVDHYWDRLSDGGETSQCAWLKDRYGVSWQIVPEALIRLLKDPDPVKSQRVMAAMMTMTKIDVAKLEAAYAG